MIRINKQFYLDRYIMSGKQRLMEIINDPEIARRTLTIPYPYTSKDADWWIQQREQERNCDEPQRSWAIRNGEGQLCGGIGSHFKYGFNSHKDEIGYWLMRDLWGKGIMTEVVAKFVEFCSTERGLIRLEAPVFDFNAASGRVLEKNGFLLEGTARKAYSKDGAYFDSLLYARVVE